MVSRYRNCGAAVADTHSKSRPDESSLCKTRITFENVRISAHFSPVELDLDIVARGRSESIVSTPIPDLGVETFGQSELWNPSQASSNFE